MTSWNLKNLVGSFTSLFFLALFYVSPQLQFSLFVTAIDVSRVLTKLETFFCIVKKKCKKGKKFAEKNDKKIVV